MSLVPANAKINLILCGVYALAVAAEIGALCFAGFVFGFSIAKGANYVWPPASK